MLSQLEKHVGGKTQKAAFSIHIFRGDFKQQRHGFFLAVGKLSEQIFHSGIELQKALDDLNLPRDKITIQALTEGQAGLFGMQGAKKAKIRVTIHSQDESQGKD